MVAIAAPRATGEALPACRAMAAVYRQVCSRDLPVATVAALAACPALEAATEVTAAAVPTARRVPAGAGIPLVEAAAIPVVAAIRVEVTTRLVWQGDVNEVKVRGGGALK